MTSWTRPESVAFPSVWRSFEGKASKRKYWIQDLTEEFEDEVCHYMSTRFILDEPLCTHSKLMDDPVLVQRFISKWRDIFKQKLSLICLTKDDNDKTCLVGCNALEVECKSDKQKHTKEESASLGIIVGLLEYVYKLKDIFSEIKSDEYLSALGLYVLPEYRGEGIGTELLKARRELCIGVGLKTSVTAFTSTGGQKSAEKAGFKDLIVFPYANTEKANPSFKFPGIENETTKFLKIMYNTYM
ncbi:hypothetical protein NQ317_015682 [Molorchus minor]|uniref:N-acetyltransferase domain-containing protein n=1 Tax=Molorchus minor TaxID=1323400 RepID=A0ABQ9JMP7_9CUCU|nr:hypothetical protein NQ317_015682 [Molorchus minor]